MVRKFKQKTLLLEEKKETNKQTKQLNLFYHIYHSFLRHGITVLIGMPTEVEKVLTKDH